MKNNLILLISFFSTVVVWCGTTLQVAANDDEPVKVVGARPINPGSVDPDSVELFEEYDFKSSPGKLHFTITLKPDQLYLPVDIRSLHPWDTDGVPGYSGFVPRILRSMKLGDNVGVLLRCGSVVGGTEIGHFGGFTDYRVLETSQKNLKSWFVHLRLNIVLYRKGIVKHPQGAGFLSFNRYNQLSGPNADSLFAVFLLANANEEQDPDRLEIYSKTEWANLEPYNYDWVTLHGKGTKLSVWINGQEKSIEATSDDPRTNTFKLSQAGMALAEVDRIKNGGKPNFSRLKVTAPKLNWVTGATKKPPSTAPQPNPTDSVAIPPNANITRSLTGRWDSNLGQTDLVQTGRKVAGTLRSTDQTLVTIIDGQLTGARLDFTSFPISGNFSHGHVLFAADGNSGEGPYISANGTTQTWKLKR